MRPGKGPPLPGRKSRFRCDSDGLKLAVTHAKLPGVKDFVVALGIHRRGLPFESLDDRPVHILVMIVGPNSQQEEYLKVLSRVTSFLN